MKTLSPYTHFFSHSGKFYRLDIRLAADQALGTVALWDLYPNCPAGALLHQGIALDVEDAKHDAKGWLMAQESVQL